MYIISNKILNYYYVYFENIKYQTMINIYLYKCNIKYT